MITLGLPWALVLLPLPFVIWRFMPPMRDRVPALRFPFFRRLTEATGADPRAGAVVRARSRFQMLVAVAIWALVVVALAQPERVGKPVERTKAARDVVLAIDISGSMDARDFRGQDGKPVQRFEAVRNVVQTFVEGRDGDRMALIVFGSKAYVQAPLTEDLDTIIALLNRTKVGMAGPHTALGDSIGLAIRTFEASEIEDRLMILLSDGSDTSSRMSPVNAAEIARGDGVEIFTIGVGDPEASGEDRVDLAALQTIATQTGGAYFYASDEAALQSIYDRIDSMAPRITETQSYRPKRALGHWPMGLAVVIGLLAVAILHLRSVGRRRVT